MATEVEIDTKIDTANAAKSLTELRKGLKDLISLQGQVGTSSASFNKLRDAINKTENKVSDLTTSFSTLRGSGVERLNSSISVFREGLLNADTGKLKAGLEGVGSAMKAVPIFLLIEGARILFENWDKVVSVFSSSSQAIKANALELEKLNQQVAANRVQTDALIITKEAELKQLERQEAGLSKVVGKINEINDLNQEQFRQELKATDKEMQNLIDQIKDLQENVQVSDFLPEFLGGGGTDEKLAELQKKLSEASVKRGELVNKAHAKEINSEQTKLDKIEAAQKKAAEAKRKRDEAENAYQEISRQNDADVAASQAQAEKDRTLKRIKELKEESDFILALKQGESQQNAEIENLTSEQTRSRRRRDLDNLLAEEKAHKELSTGEKILAIESARTLELSNEQLTQDQRVAIIQKAEADILAIKTASAMRALAIAQQFTDVLNEVNDYFNQQENQRIQELQDSKDVAIQNEEARVNRAVNNDALSAEQKDQIQAESKNNQLKIEDQFAKEQTKVKKQQFDREKALKLVHIAIDTASALVKTTAELGGVGAITPPGLALLAGITALGVAQAAVVASQKFDDNGGGGSSSIPSPPRISSGGGGFDAESQPRNPTTFNPTGISNKQNPQKVYVLDRDIKDVAAKVDVIEQRATFG